MIVIGGGAAGAAAAFRLRSQGHEVVLLEATEEIGGRTRTLWRDGFGVEFGAIYLLNSYERCLALLEEAGRSDVLAPWSPAAGLWDGEQLHELRYDYIPSFFRLGLLSSRDKLRLAVGAARVVLAPAPSPFEPDSLARFDDGEDMETWSRRLLGDQLFECFVRPMIEPSFGVDARDLSTPYLRGIMKRAHRARFYLPVGGMGGFCEALLNGVDVRLGAQAVSVEGTDGAMRVHLADGTHLDTAGVVVATDSRVAADLLSGLLDDDQLSTLRAAPYASMSHAVLRWQEDPWPERLTEMILPVGAGPRALLGTIVKTSRTSRCVPSGARMMNAYFSSEATRTLNDEAILEIALQQVRDVLGDSFPAPETEVIRIDRALASCPPGHYARMSALRSAMPAGIALAGDHLAHLGVETAVVSGERAALQLAGLTSALR